MLVLHRLRQIAALGALLLLGACQSSNPSANLSQQLLGDGITAREALSELAALTTPETVDQQVFAELKTGLAAWLSSQQDRRFVTAAPGGLAGKVLDLTVYSNGDGSATCRWTYNNYGDYDLNSQVTIGDLTPVGQHYRKKAAQPDWPLAAVADGDLNGEVNIGDITPIGQYLASSVEGYRLQSNATGDPQDLWADVAEVPFDASAVQAIGGPRRFSQVVPAAAVDTYFRVVPFHGASAGEPSDPQQYVGDVAPQYSVTGTCRDGSAAGLAGVAVTLDDQLDAVSAATGEYSFSGLADGYLGYLTALQDGLTVLPQQRVVQIAGADLTEADFTAFAADHIDHNLPTAQPAGQQLVLNFNVVDAAAATLAGFTTEAELVITPPAGVVTRPGLSLTVDGRQVAAANDFTVPLTFTDGVAQLELTFADPGAYALALAGLGAILDGPLAELSVTAAEPPELQFAKWRDGATAAISLTFDDGTADHWNRGMPLWEEYGFRVTLGILANRFQSEPARLPQLQEAFAAGHELANHTTTHPDLTTLTEAQVREELQTCQDLVLDNVTGLDRMLTVIYPYQEFNAVVITILQDMGYLFARSGVQDMVNVTALNDAWNPHQYNLYSWANLNNLPAWMWNDTVDSAVNTGNWLIEQCHGIGAVGETGVGWSPQPESAFRTHYDHIKSYGDQVWVAPLSEVGRYLLERNQAHFNVLSFSSEEVSFLVYDALDDAIYDVPLTIRLEQTAGWTAVTVKQGLIEIPAELRAGWFVFDVTPSGGVVKVSRQP